MFIANKIQEKGTGEADQQGLRSSGSLCQLLGTV